MDVFKKALSALKNSYWTLYRAWCGLRRSIDYQFESHYCSFAHKVSLYGQNPEPGWRWFGEDLWEGIDPDNGSHGREYRVLGVGHCEKCGVSLIVEMTAIDGTLHAVSFPNRWVYIFDDKRNTVCLPDNFRGPYHVR